MTVTAADAGGTGSATSSFTWTVRTACAPVTNDTDVAIPDVASANTTGDFALNPAMPLTRRSH